MIATSTALITGASGGIGLEFARLCARDHYNLIIVARSEKVLEKIAADLRKEYGIAVTVFVGDLSILATAEKLVAMVERENIKIDLLINNAGFGEFGYFKETDWHKELEMMNLNMVTLTFLTKVFVRKMVNKDKGNILNVASIAAFQPGPLMAVYFATKAYVLSFSEAVASELQGTGVSVTVLCPGPTVSGFQKAAHLDSSAVYKGKLPTSREVAEAGYKALKTGKVVVVPGFKNKMLIQLLRLMPRFVVRNFIRNAQEVKAK